MKKALLISSTFAIVAGILLVQIPSAHSTGSGAPAGYTGSPGDNRTCATSGCHSGTATPRAGMISSNIPETGYLPGETYSITISASQAGINKWGFQASPQNNSGTLLGTLVNTESTRTQINGAGKYVTHRSGGTAGAGSISWTFDWIAPSAGTGQVNFYTTVNATNSNNSTSGDAILTDVLSVQEDASASNSLSPGLVSFVVYPNPAEGNTLFVKGITANSAYVIRDLAGRIMQQGILSASGTLSQIDLSRLEKGVYLIQTEGKLARFVRK